MAALEVRVLGPPEVRVAGTVARITSWKAVALLGYLAVEPGAHARQRLAALFWPDAMPEVAQSSLRNALTLLRHALGPCADRLVTDRRTAQLRLAPDDRLDVQVLLQGHPDAYRGDFLEGVPLEATEGLGAWLEAQRDRLRALAGQAYDQHTRTLLDTAPGDAVDAARRWLALDDLNEEAWRRVIRAYHAAGQRHQARAALAACHAVLQRELGVAPAPETLALGLQVVEISGRVTRAAVVQHGPPAFFVGRAAEQAQLRATFHSVMDGTVHVTVLLGEPGIGKTSLAQAFAQWTEDQGARVLRGRALSTQGSTLGSWSDLLRSAVETGFSPHVLPPLWRSEAARVLPEWAAGDVHPGDAGDLTFLFEALARTLRAVAGDAPLVLVLDDVQWMDPASRDALMVVAHRLPQLGMRVMVVLTVRAEAVGPATLAAAWLTQLGRSVPVTRLTLGPLSETETQAFVTLHARDEDARDVGTWLYAQSLGQPLYLGQAFKALIERDAIERTGDGWRLRWAQVPALAPGVREVIEERCSHLSPAGLAVAQGCAVLGEHATFDVLRQVAGLDEQGALAGCEELLQGGLLSERPGATDLQYLLAHERVRETVYGLLSAPRRQLLHRRALAAIEAHAPPDVLAWHAAQGGRIADARALLRRSAQEAGRLGFSAAARAALERALALNPQGHEHVELLLLCAEACERLGDEEGQRRMGTEALHRAQELDLPDLVVQSLNRLAWVEAESPDVARPLSEQALALARTLGDPSLLASSLQGVARSYRHENPSLALTLQGEAMTHLHTLGDVRRLGFGHMNTAYTHFALGNLDEELSHFHHAVNAFHSAGHTLLEALTLAELGTRLIDLGRAGEAVTVLHRAVRLRERSRPRAPIMRAVWACALAQTGDPGAGWTVMLEGLDEPIEPPVGRLTLSWVARFLLACGQTGAAVVVLGAGQVTSPQASHTEPHVAAVLVRAQSELGHTETEGGLSRGSALTLDEALALIRSLAPA